MMSDVDLSFGLNSDSIWRGIDQNDDNPTLGAEAEINLENGFYTNIWLESCCSDSADYPNREVGFSVGIKSIQMKMFRFHWLILEQIILIPKKIISMKLI